ncbi:MAG: hypothetical protein IJQ81_05475 [Oscillibacter sp.]|nr:hypothetical protein [Oscillibacter sp.]
MLEATVSVEAPGYMAQGLKESLCMAAEKYGAARAVSVREIPCGPGADAQCRMETMSRFPWEGATRTRKG